MSNEMAFFVYLLEKYAEYKNENTYSLLKEWENSKLIDYIMQMYPMYHTERIENAFADIDRLLNFST
jgi:iron-sulfur cluster repair protein YtfE (RIC family)